MLIVNDGLDMVKESDSPVFGLRTVVEVPLELLDSGATIITVPRPFWLVGDIVNVVAWGPLRVIVVYRPCGITTMTVPRPVE